MLAEVPFTLSSNTHEPFFLKLTGGIFIFDTMDWIDYGDWDKILESPEIAS